MRAVIYSTVLPAIVGLAAAARSVGLEPVAVITPRAARNPQAAARRDAILTSAPEGLDLCFAADKASLERLTRAYEPELGLCTGYPWLLPPEVLSIPRLGVVNTHPSRLPRLRGPYPFAWAIREGDDEIWLTAHLMDEEFDTGPILAPGLAADARRHLDGRPRPDARRDRRGGRAGGAPPRPLGRSRRPADRRGGDVRGALRRGLCDPRPRPPTRRARASGAGLVVDVRVPRRRPGRRDRRSARCWSGRRRSTIPATPRCLGWTRPTGRSGSRPSSRCSEEQ